MSRCCFKKGMTVVVPPAEVNGRANGEQARTRMEEASVEIRHDLVDRS
jgi:hypothetical protein